MGEEKTAGSPKLNLFEEKDDSPDTFMRGERLFEGGASPRRGDVASGELRQIMMGDGEGNKDPNKTRAVVQAQQNPQPPGPPSYIDQPPVWLGGGSFGGGFPTFVPIPFAAYPPFFQPPPPSAIWPPNNGRRQERSFSAVGSLAACPLQQQQSTRVIHNTSPLGCAGGRTVLQKPKMWARWSNDEDELLRKAVQKHGDHDFNLISEQIFHGSRTETQCRNRWQRAVQPGVKTGKWTKEEDERVKNAVNEHIKNSALASDGGAIINWPEVANQIPMRSVDQVRNRWTQRLDPTLKHGIWSAEEMRVLENGQRELGNNWEEISLRLPGRTKNMVKNRWYNLKTTNKKNKKRKVEETAAEGVVGIPIDAPSECGSLVPPPAVPPDEL